MKKLPKIVITAFCITSLFFSIGVTPSQAQSAPLSSVGIATYLPVNGNRKEDGDIVIANNKGYFLSNALYDPQVVGVITTKPAISLKTSSSAKGQTPGVPVVSIGTVYTKVSGMNGAIKKGDFITTSSKEGVGMKATRSGYILGTAIEDASFANANEVKKIQVNLNLHFLQIGTPGSPSLWDVFNIGKIASYEQPLRVFQYLISAVVIIISFSFGFVIFSKAINTGIQALGRNPLAGRMIQLSILFNVVLVIIIIMTGIGIVYLFLKL